MTTGHHLRSGAAPRPEHGEAAAATATRPPRRHRFLAVSGTIALSVLVLAVMLVGGALVTNHDLHRSVPASQADAARDTGGTVETVAAHAAERGRRPIVVAFVAGTSGTVASDLLAPYDVFASSPAVHPYVVAAHARPVPLEGGPALVPAHTFAEVAADPALTPDLVVVPALSKPTSAIEAPLRRWVTRQHDAGARVLAVCAGSLVLAETGMLDGLHATSHWSRIGALRNSRPAVHWEKGRRWVEDGSITTTAAVSSGVPAALHLVAELVGTGEAQRVADLHPELGWTPDQSTVIPADHFAASDWPVGLGFVEPWFRPTVGIALHDGVGELDATAAFEVYGQSTAAGTVALAAGDTTRTQHGLVLLTTRFSDAPHVSRVVVPGGGTSTGVDPGLRAWADDRGVSVDVLSGGSGRQDVNGVDGGGFAAALEDLADHTDATTASSTAKMIGYPTAGLRLGDAHGSSRTVLLAAASLALAVLVGRSPAMVLARRRTRRSFATSAR